MLTHRVQRALHLLEGWCKLVVRALESLADVTARGGRHDRGLEELLLVLLGRVHRIPRFYADARGLSRIVAIQVHLSGLLVRDRLDEQAFGQSLIQTGLLLELGKLRSLPLQAGGQVLIDREHLGLTRAHLLEHLVQIELDRADGDLGLRDLALAAHFENAHSRADIRLVLLQAHLDLLETGGFESVYLPPNVGLNLDHRL